MWHQLGTANPQADWTKWHQFSSIDLGLAEKALIKIEFNSANFSRIFSSCWLRYQASGIASQPQLFKVQETPVLANFLIYPQIGSEITFEAKWKNSGRYSREGSWTVSLSYWEL
jgi:hypothetical protein